MVQTRHTIPSKSLHNVNWSVISGLWWICETSLQSSLYLLILQATYHSLQLHFTKIQSTIVPHGLFVNISQRSDVTKGTWGHFPPLKTFASSPSLYKVIHCTGTTRVDATFAPPPKILLVPYSPPLLKSWRRCRPMGSPMETETGLSAIFRQLW